MEAPPALVPAYAFNGPGEPIPLRQGRVQASTGHSATCSVDLRCRVGLDLGWVLDGDVAALNHNLDDIVLRIDSPLGAVTTTGHRRSRTEGWLDPTTIGDSRAKAVRIVAHWINLPAIRSPQTICSADSLSVFTGRWTAQVSGWIVTLDRRPDHSEVWRQLRADGTSAMTHVMEIRRADGADFVVELAQPVLDALHLAVSFALGRWVAPVLPVALDRSDQRVWEQWAVLQSAPGVLGSLRWWDRQRDHDLAELLRCVVSRYLDPGQRFTLRFMLASAVQSAAIGLVEQRVVMAASAIEHLTWVRFVRGEGMSRRRYKKLHAAGRLRKLLEAARVPTEVDQVALPTLHKFATRDEADGPAAVVHVRNELVHPGELDESIYRFDGLLREAWFLIQQYLVLLLLHHVGFHGSYQPLIRPGSWVGDVQLVPWADRPEP